MQDYYDISHECSGVFCDYCKKQIYEDGFRIYLKFEFEDYHRGDLDESEDHYELCDECKEKIHTTLAVTNDMKSIRKIFPKEEYKEYRFRRIKIHKHPIEPMFKYEIEERLV